jgi:uncharacterized protein YkwD
VLVVALLSSPAAASPDEPAIAWSAWTASPIAIDSHTLAPLEQEALLRCGSPDAGLVETARWVLARKLRGLPTPEFDEIAWMQRAAGEPHSWARAWVATGGTLEQGATWARLDAWLGAPATSAPRRCGTATGAAADGARTLVVVAVDALADLAPLPTRARPGEWLTVEARLRVPAAGGEVILLGPSGLPRRVPTSFRGSTLRARFAPDRPGKFELQVVADVAGGPRPVLEAILFAGVEPTAQSGGSRAPGEEAADDRLDDGDSLARMMTAARASVGLPPLVRDARLDAVARAHAAQMASAHVLAHDLGGGDAPDRLRAASIERTLVGENVAHASSVRLAHRSLWMSPSHRSNLLRREFDRVGLGVARDEHGDAWVVELLVR